VESDRLQVNADLKVRAPGDRTEIVPQLRSSFSISERVGVETRVDLAEWNASSDLGRASINTRLHFRSLAPFLDELEGSVWRSPDGETRQILKFGFYQILRAAGLAPALTLHAKATVESALGAVPSARARAPERPEMRRVGFEAVLGGLLPELGIADNSLRLKMERTSGGQAASRDSLTYDHGWQLGPTGRIGFNLAFGREPSTLYRVTPSFGITWRAQF
jgi:hypothetical protein